VAGDLLPTGHYPLMSGLFFQMMASRKVGRPEDEFGGDEFFQ